MNSSNIFADNAPAFWDHGFSAVPIKPGTKQPTINKWQSYQANLPAQDRRQDWRSRYPDHGLGILTGTEIATGYQLVAIDVDDDKLVRGVVGFMLSAPCAKRGKKGLTIFALAPKKDALKSTVFKGTGGTGNVDMLIGGRLTIVPPTVHPDTGAPYEWIGESLFRIPSEELPVLDRRKFRSLKKLIGSKHVSSLVAGEATHDPAVSLTAELVGAGSTDDEILGAVRGLLPSHYEGDTLRELAGMIESARAKGFDQSDDDGPGKQSKQTLGLVSNAGLALFRDKDGETYASIPSASGGIHNHPVSSSAVRNFANYLYFKETGNPLSGAAAREVIDTLDAMARFDGPIRETHVRFAEEEGVIYIDLGREDNKCVKIAAAGWSIVEHTPVAFVRPPGFEEIPLPVRGETLGSLNTILALEASQFQLLMVFLLSCHNPYGPCFALLPYGPQGSGKSVLSSLMKQIVDPSASDRSALPRSEHDLAIQASQNRLLVFDCPSSGFLGAIAA